MNLTTAYNKKQIFSYGILFLSGLYFVFISVYSINQADLGFQLSAVGRLKAGQVIYKDFDFIRPFFGVIFWDYLLKYIPLQFDYSILISRILVIIESFIICRVIQKLVFDREDLYTTVFLTLCFLHTFPVMPWHTIDGIFFSVLALLFYKKKWYLSALLFIVFASLTKQSFAIFGLGASLIIMIDLFKKPVITKKDLYVFIPSFLFLIAVLFQYRIIENFNLFAEQVLHSASPSYLYEGCIAPYLFFEKNFLTVLYILSLILIYFININRKVFEILLIIILPVFIIYPFFNSGQFKGAYVLYVFLFILFLKYERQNKFIFLLLFLGWCSSISWGYNTPAFFILILLYRFIEKQDRLFLPLWGIILTVFSIYRSKYPYSSESLTPKHLFIKNIPAVSGLLVSEKEYSYILEAQQINKLHKDVIFLPASPLLDIINVSYLNRASWEMDVEYPSWKSDLQKFKRNTIAVDNSLFPYYKEGFFISSITLELMKQKKVIRKTKYFTVYSN
ncbi:hypothetical protein [Chryseobacterium shigense]|uniref:Dolichyl-phosphate-mannose-protein mannosyltransferase n=1 Tax=Chryseobacterium shigense TaxID=297244 RepID=A0A841NDA7_9FLAO|nr:hypothetical protein [Chryseobacterium shigense]MBB6372691.1 hypothetical protein [Chryseobacterium shigense]